MLLLSWMLRKIKMTIKVGVTALLIALSIIAATLLVHAANDFVDLLGSPTVGEQKQSIENLPPFIISDGQREVNPNLRKPMIGLYRLDKHGKPQFHCTAFVVSDKYAITASHCLVDLGYFMTKDDILVYDMSLKDTKIVVHAAAMDYRADFGLLIGDFSSFNKMMINTDSGFVGLTGPFFVCGFPWGSTPPICNQFIPKSAYYDKVGGSGFLHPGMSGGPVVDGPTGVVAAINVEVHEGFIAVAPLVGFFGALGVQVQQ